MVRAGQSASRARCGGRARILPIGEVDLRTAAPAACGGRTRRLRVRSGDHSGSEAFAQDLKHKESTVGAGIGKIEAFVYDRKIRDNISQDRLAERGPILQRGIFDLAASETVIASGANPVENFSTPTLYEADRDGTFSERRHLNFNRAVRQCG